MYIIQANSENMWNTNINIFLLPYTYYTVITTLIYSKFNLKSCEIYDFRRSMNYTPVLLNITINF